MGINVISLFDGMSCGQIALDRLGINVNTYVASEIDKHAIKVAKANYPNTAHMGSVIDLNFENGVIYNWMDEKQIGKVDLLIGGSPCQNFSFAGTRKGMVTSDNLEILSLEHYISLKESGFTFQGQSFLFWEYVRLLKEIKPKYFLLENVKMVKKWENLITEILGVAPIEINSALVSAQNRKRLYWTNIEGVTQPLDKKILLKGIVHEHVDHFYSFKTPNFNVNPSGKGMNGGVRCVNNIKSSTLTTNKGEGAKISFPTGLWVCKNSEWAFVDREKALSVLAGFQNANGLDYFNRCKSQIVYEALAKYIVPFDKTLQILDKEVEKGKVGFFRKDSQANRIYYIHDKAVTLCGEAGGGAAKMGSYLFGCITPDRIEKRQNGQRFSDGRKFYTLTAQDKHGILIEGYIRKLTPVECERLQTVEDNYTNHVSDSQRYRMLGNGWTVDVIAHILSFAKL